jgi:hypothetical protein
MPTSSQRPSSSSRDLTLVVESESGTPEEYFAQVGLSIGLEREWSLQVAEQLPNVNYVNLERTDFVFECAEDML